MACCISHIAIIANAFSFCFLSCEKIFSAIRYVMEYSRWEQSVSTQFLCRTSTICWSFSRQSKIAHREALERHYRGNIAVLLQDNARTNVAQQEPKLADRPETSPCNFFYIFSPLNTSLTCQRLTSPRKYRASGKMDRIAQATEF